MELDFSKYIGKSHDEYNCYDLFRAIQSNFGIKLPEFEYNKDRHAVSEQIDMELLARYKRLEEPELFCGVVMYDAGIPCHIACYIGDGKIIHSTSARGVTIDDLDMKEVEGFYGVRQ